MTTPPVFFRRVAELAFFPALGLAAILVFAVFLISLRLEKAVGDLTAERANLQANRVAEVLEGAGPIPVARAAPTDFLERLQPILSGDEELLTLAWFDADGHPIYRQDWTDLVPELNRRMVQRVLDAGLTHKPLRTTRAWRANGEDHVVMQLRSADGVTLGAVWVVHSTQAAQAAFTSTLGTLVPASLITLLAGTVVIFSLSGLFLLRWERQVGHAQFHLQALDAGTSVGSLPEPGGVLPLMQALQHVQDADQELLCIDAALQGESSA